MSIIKISDLSVVGSQSFQNELSDRELNTVCGGMHFPDPPPIPPLGSWRSSSSGCFRRFAF